MMAHVLWAEDSQVDRMFIQAVLRDVPGRPATEFVDDGEELLERLQTCQPDLVVIDLMPEVGGLEVLAQLRECGFTAPIVVFSGAEGADTIAACYRLGVREFIQKPAEFREFRSRVERVVAAIQPWPTKAIERPVLLVSPP